MASTKVKRRTGLLLSLQRKQAILGYIFISPWIIRFLWLDIGPILASLYFSFTEYSVLSSPKWIGSANYVRAFTRERLFPISIWNTAYYVGLSVPLGLILGFTVAYILNTKIKGITLFRTIFYMPSLVPGVASAMLWLWLLNASRIGIFNYVLGWFGIGPINWLGDPAMAKPSLILMSLWGVGGGMVIYLAGLQSIPTVLYESAELDGANGWQKFWNITIPMMTPTILFNLIMGIIGSFQVFDSAFITTHGGPANATYFYMLYLYDNAFSYFRMGYASALAWMLFLVLLVLTMIIFRTSGRWVFYERT